MACYVIKLTDSEVMVQREEKKWKKKKKCYISTLIPCPHPEIEKEVSTKRFF